MHVPDGYVPGAPSRATRDDLEMAEQAGRESYRRGLPAAPGADSTVRRIIAGWPVGSGAVDVFTAFLHGRQTAAEQALTAAPDAGTALPVDGSGQGGSDIAR
jgi:hypothetical protein